MTSKSDGRRVGLGAGAAFVVALVLGASACSSSGTKAASSGSGGSASGSSTTASSTTLAQLNTELSAASAVPTFKSTLPAIDVKSLAGKKIFLVPLAPSAASMAENDALKDAATASAVTLTICNNQGKQSQWAQCLSQALSTRQDAVIVEVDPSVVRPQLQALKAAGIPVLSNHYYPAGQSASAVDVSAIQPAAFGTAAKLMADWVIKDSNGQAQVLIALLPGFAPTPPMQSAFESEFKQKCPSCTYKLVNVSISDLQGSGFQTSMSSALNANPKVNYIISQVDSLLPGTSAALTTTGRPNVKITSFNGTTDGLATIQKSAGKSGGLVMDVGEPSAWIAYAAMDNTFRLLLKMPTDPNPTPLRVFTAANAADAGTPPTVTAGYGNAYINGYLRLWGLS